MAHTTEPTGDYADHVNTYDGFIRLLKWTTGSIIVLLLLMAYFLL